MCVWCQRGADQKIVSKQEIHYMVHYKVVSAIEKNKAREVWGGLEILNRGLREASLK